MNRKDFLTTVASFAGVSTFGSVRTLAALAPPPAQEKQPKPPPLSPESVREFVGAGHGNLEKVQELLKTTPGLLNATWDWGGGDFETAIGGAGHMGRRDIAEYLISQGARMDIFVAAMLGKLDVVKALLTAYPSLAQSKGPHGITLLTHAQKGGAAAEPVLEFLRSQGVSGK